MDDPATLEKARKRQKPQIDMDTARRLANSHYGLNVASACELDSYDDRNFRLETLDGAGYVLKIHNGVDSDPVRRAFLDAQNTVLHYLNTHGVPCPQPVTTATGAPYAEEALPRSDGVEPVCHVIRLLTYVPGDLMCSHPHPPELLQNLGAFVARLETALDGFDHPGLHRSHLWDLARLPALAPFVQYITDKGKRELVTSIITLFRQQVEPVAPTLRRGVCHSDINDHNIVVGGEPPLNIAGIIDFGDMVYTFRINELAICIAYALLDKDDLVATANTIFQGYSAVRPIPAEERALLHTLVCARLSQSVIMSSYSFSLDPTNTYLLVTSQPGWKALHALAAMSAGEIAAFNSGGSPESEPS